MFPRSSKIQRDARSTLAFFSLSVISLAQTDLPVEVETKLFETSFQIVDTSIVGQKCYLRYGQNTGVNKKGEDADSKITI